MFSNFVTSHLTVAAKNQQVVYVAPRQVTIEMGRKMLTSDIVYHVWSAIHPEGERRIKIVTYAMLTSGNADVERTEQATTFRSITNWEDFLIDLRAKCSELNLLVRELRLAGEDMMTLL